MERNPYPSKHRRLYYTYNTLGIIIGTITFFSFKIVPAIIAVFAIVYFKKKIGDESWAMLIGTGIFWLALGTIGYFIVKYIGGLGGYYFDQAEKYKKNYSFTYGRDFKKPTFEDYGLDEKLYRSFHYYKGAGGWFVPVVLVVTIIEMNVTARREPLLLIAPIGLGFLAILLAWYVGKQLRLRQSQYENVTRYDEAMKIYEAIQQEIRIEKFREEYKEKERRRKILANRR